MRIILDAGHGGVDPGAISKDGKKREKDYTLEYEEFLSTYLSNSGFKVIKTRITDTNTPFHARTSIAHPEDLFISIHFDEDSYYGGGSSIYYANYYKTAEQRMADSKRLADDEQIYLLTNRVTGSTTSRFQRLYIDDNACPAILIEVTSIDKADNSEKAMSEFSQKVLSGINKYRGLAFNRVFIVNKDNTMIEVEIERMSIVGDKLYIAPKNKLC